MTARLDETNTHTFFLRERESLDAVVKNVRSGGSVWSAGCSTGEEVYSLALLARQSGVELQITGSDINRVALKIARRGLYPERRVRNVDNLQRAAAFDADADGLNIKPELRERVFFTRHDIARDAPLTNDGGDTRSWDAILCRNVFLYLSADEIDFALASFARALKPGGVLFFGASELMSSVLHSHRPRQYGLILTELGGAWGYRRRDPAAPVLTLPPPPPRPQSVPRPVPEPAPLEPAATPPPAPAPRDDVVAALRTEGDRFLDAGDPRGALDIYEKAAERDGLLADIHMRIAVCPLRTGSPHGARDALRRSLFLEPALWPAAMLLGDLVEESDPQIARQYFQQALDALGSEARGVLELDGALAPFIAGRRAAAEALECRLRLLDRRPTAVAHGGQS